MAEFKEISPDAPTGQKLLNWIDNRFPLTKLYNEHLAEYYAPKNFNFWYFFGSLAMVVLAIQLITGIFLVMFYKPDGSLNANGVPVAFASGDDVFIAETRPLFPSATFVQTKTASGNGSGVSLAPEAACAAIRAGMAQALRAVPARPELTLAAPLAVRLQTQTPALADLFSLWPTLEREAPDVIAFEAASMQDAVRTLNALSAMSAVLR